MLALTSPPVGRRRARHAPRGAALPCPHSVGERQHARRGDVSMGPGTRFAARALTLLGATLLIAGPAAAQTRQTGPCDIYAAGGTPCVAAHSTTRALYATYNGPLYQVMRQSDNTTKDIGVLDAGRLRQRGRAGLVLRQHDLPDHHALRPVRRCTTTSPRRRAAASAAPAWAAFNNLPIADMAPITRQRPQGLRRLHRARHRPPQQQPQRHRGRRPARGHVRGLQRPPLQRRLLLRLRQRRDRQPRRRQRHDGDHLLRQRHGLVPRRRAPARGS